MKGYTKEVQAARVSEIKEKLASLSGTEAGYLTGLIDGEGCIDLHSYRSKKTGRLCSRGAVSISNTDPRIIQWLSERLGGAIITRPQKKSKIGTIHRESFTWYVSGHQAREVLGFIQHLLVAKKDQAEIYQTFFSLMGKPRKSVSDENMNKRKECETRLKALRSPLKLVSGGRNAN